MGTERDKQKKRKDNAGDIMHTHAHVSFKPGGPIHQESAGLNVWKPNVDVDDRKFG